MFAKHTITKIILTGILMLVFTSAAYSDIIYQEITVNTTPVGINTANLSTSWYGHSLFCTVETASIRILWTGERLLQHSDMPIMRDTLPVLTDLTNIKNFKAVRSGTTDAVLRCTYE